MEEDRETRDIVYCIGEEAKDDHLELRYSLRSIEKYAKGLGKVVIVGHCPSWINRDEVLVIETRDRWYKERNIMENYKRVCHDARVSSDFVMFNDDYYLLDDMNLLDIPNYIRPYDLHEYYTLPGREKLQWRKYTRLIMQTRRALLKKNLPILCYDIHIPTVINSEKFVEAMDSFGEWDCDKGLGINYRSIYGNYWGLDATVHEDVKVHKIIDGGGLERWLEGKKFFSSDKMCKWLDWKLSALFGDKSKYEL